ncbi:MAG: 2'-5' RNA ligase family protein [Comamonas sp.]|nr:2'-5' RNA ligase family protein [Comamonas sp.]
MNAATSLLTQPCEDRDFVDWHRGCPWCAVWLVWLGAPQWQARVEQARSALQPWLLPRYARQPHISLAYRGLMCGAQTHSAAEFGRAQLRADIACLHSLQLAPWEIRVQGSDSFSTVPYLAASDAGSLQAVHQALTPHMPAPDWRYVPHVTLGHYAQAVPMADMVRTLQSAVHGQAPMVETVQQLWLARYRTHDIAGPLALEGCWDLRSQCYVPQPGALLHP